MKYLVFLLFSFSMYAESLIYPFPNWMEIPSRNPNWISPLSSVFQKGVQFCGAYYKGTLNHKKEGDIPPKPDRNQIYTLGEWDNLFVFSPHPKIQERAMTYLTLFFDPSAKYWVAKSRCCPMGPCYTSYIYENQKGKWNLVDKMEGEVIYYSKQEDHSEFALEDMMVSGLIFQGKKRGKEMEIELVYPNQIEYPRDSTVEQEVSLKTGVPIPFYRKSISIPGEEPLFTKKFSEKIVAHLLYSSSKRDLLYIHPPENIKKEIIQILYLAPEQLPTIGLSQIKPRQIQSRVRIIAWVDKGVVIP